MSQHSSPEAAPSPTPGSRRRVSRYSTPERQHYDELTAESLRESSEEASRLRKQCDETQAELDRSKIALHKQIKPLQDSVSQLEHRCKDLEDEKAGLEGLIQRMKAAQHKSDLNADEQTKQLKDFEQRVSDLLEELQGHQHNGEELRRLRDVEAEYMQVLEEAARKREDVRSEGSQALYTISGINEYYHNARHQIDEHYQSVRQQLHEDLNLPGEDQLQENAAEQAELNAQVKLNASLAKRIRANHDEWERELSIEPEPRLRQVSLHDELEAMGDLETEAEAQPESETKSPAESETQAPEEAEAAAPTTPPPPEATKMPGSSPTSSTSSDRSARRRALPAPLRLPKRNSSTRRPPPGNLARPATISREPSPDSRPLTPGNLVEPLRQHVKRFEANPRAPFHIALQSATIRAPEASTMHDGHVVMEVEEEEVVAESEQDSKPFSPLSDSDFSRFGFPLPPEHNLQFFGVSWEVSAPKSEPEGLPEAKYGDHTLPLRLQWFLVFFTAILCLLVLAAASYIAMSAWEVRQAWIDANNMRYRRQYVWEWNHSVWRASWWDWLVYWMIKQLGLYETVYRHPVLNA
ncbi:uncharacterized protein AB675_10007 [Cyphellophora attinorum]|uniref:Uncharacterized protein n=1 Tax=Cyphellophora attinorum TaxID=1664694 RepID=A0A0N1H425_9EURO|nr:uncharacterized protein AB675_10007 [Phialophora attinorum]KPI36637.1 hypothetical protein AB675_10007 [Phialophora attinorum]